jgi:hypothetical protein
MKPRFCLRTLLIVLALAPPLLAGLWFGTAWPGSAAAILFLGILSLIATLTTDNG